MICVGLLLLPPPLSRSSLLSSPGPVAAPGWARPVQLTLPLPLQNPKGTGACLLYGISRVVIGENKNFVGGESYLRSRGVEVVVLDNAECKELMDKFIAEKPELWYVQSPTLGPLPPMSTCHLLQDRNEDIGVEERVWSKEGKTAS